MPWGPSVFLSLAKENKTTQTECKHLEQKTNYLGWVTVTLGTVLWVAIYCRKRQENQQVHDWCNPPKISAMQLE